MTKPLRYQVPLAAPAFGHREIQAVLGVLASKELTCGHRVRRFEGAFARYCGAEYGVMTNSGSSANLLALAVLTSPYLGPDRLQPGDEVITPAVTWPTTVYPIAQSGLMPVIVDVDEYLGIDVRRVEEAITERTRAIFAVHLLGNPCELTALQALCEKHRLHLLEDACEGHGAEWDGRRVGSWGLMGTFSFYWSHHATAAGEGGILLTSNPYIAEAARSLRAFGWTRLGMHPETSAAAFPDIDPRYCFYAPGYNVRPTEMQAAFASVQLRRLPGFVRRRRERADWLTERLAPLADGRLVLPAVRTGGRHAWLFYALRMGPDAAGRRDALMAHLEKRGIETRPVMTGNIARQPVLRWVPHRVAGPLDMAEALHQDGLLVGLPNRLADRRQTNDAQRIATAIEEFFR